MDPETGLGPLATEQILQGVDDQVQKTIAAGAKLLTGGNRIQGPGFFYEPTVLVDVPKDSPAYREEVFGPVAAVFRVGDVHAGDQARERHDIRPWVRARGPTIAKSRNSLRPSWTPEWFLSTPWSRPIRVCHSVV